tara:strand:- start:3675 stop:4547 length:873 start_codon:yes stop_codon:yes gene_type:complete
MKNLKKYESFIFEKEDKFGDYPKAASKNAKQAIEWKEKHGRDEVQGGTEVGWQRAHQLAKGEAVSRDVLGRMAAFNRHRKNSKISAEHKDTPWKDNGHVAWLIWGGDEGVDWAIKKMEELDESVKESEEHDGMSFAHLENIIDNAHGLRKRYEAGYTFDAWMHGKILKAKDYLTSVYDSLDGSDGQLESNDYFISEKEDQTNDKSKISGKGIETGLKKKADETGVPIGILRVIMRRGMAAWKTGHRPGTNQTQWGYARVNSFLTKGDGTWGKADKDMAKEVRDGGHDKKL